MGGYCHLPPINLGEAEKRGGGGTIRPAKQQPDDQQLTNSTTEHVQQEEGSVKAAPPHANHNNQKEKEAPPLKNNNKDRAKNHTLEPVPAASTNKTDAGGGAAAAAPSGEADAPPSPQPAAGGIAAVQALPKKKASTSPTRAVGATRPGSGGSNASVPRYPASILHNRDPLYNYHRREKRRRRKMRMTEPSPVSQTTSGLLPKVSQGQNIPTKSLGYQPSFQFGPGTLPKIGGTTNTTTTATFLPSLGQAFVKPAKPKQMAQAGAGQPTKNIFGHYQLPSIDRRGGGH